MAKLGTSAHVGNYNQAVGSTPPIIVTKVDQWQEIARLSDFSFGSASECAFAVFGCYGNVGGAVPPGSDAWLEITVGPVGQPDPRIYVRHRLLDSLISFIGTAVWGRARPFFLVRNYTAGGRGNYNPNTPFAVYAKINSNGTPASELAPFFEVSGISILCFDIDAIGSGNSVSLYRTDLNSLNGVFQGAAGPGWNTHALQVGGFAATEYLMLGGVKYIAGSELSGQAPHFQLTHTPDGSTAAQVPVFGTERLGYRGSVPRGQQNRQEHFAVGGARTFTATTSSGIGCRGRDFYAGTQTWVKEFEAFAVKTSVFAPWFQKVQDDNPEAIYSDTNAGGLVPFEGAEFTLPYPENFVILANVMRSTVGQPRAILNANGYKLWLFNDRAANAEVNQGENLHIVTTDVVEGCPNTLGSNRQIPDGTVQIQAYCFDSIGLAYPFPDHWPATDFFICGWAWDPSIVYQPFPSPAALPAVVIQPPKEALGTSSLTALPIEPENAYDEDFDGDDENHEHRADDGTVYTWPQFLTPRTVWSFEWILSTADLETLLAFFHGIANRAFKWTPPGESAAVPLVKTTNLQARDVGGGFHRVSMQAIELRFVGS